MISQAWVLDAPGRRADLSVRTVCKKVLCLANILVETGCEKVADNHDHRLKVDVAPMASYPCQPKKELALVRWYIGTSYKQDSAWNQAIVSAHQRS